MSVTIRSGGLIRDQNVPLHVCKLPDISLYRLKTKISCDECGQWWKAKYHPNAKNTQAFLQWKKMRRKERYFDVMKPVNGGPGVEITL